MPGKRLDFPIKGRVIESLKATFGWNEGHGGLQYKGQVGLIPRPPNAENCSK